MRRLVIGTTIAALLGSWWLLAGPVPNRVRIPRPAVMAIVFDPLDTPLLQPYKRYRDALLAGDTTTLEELAAGDGFLAYRAASTLAHDETLPSDARLRYYQRLLALRPDEPLAREETRELLLDYAALAEAAGRTELARDLYAEALPAEEAEAGLRRLETNPYRLANAFYKARRYRDALDALGELTAPSIEAPAHRALGEYEQALDAYERWLAEQPGNTDALFGRAWSHFYLGNLDKAETLFTQLGGSSALYGRALIANRRGELEQAVALLEQSGAASHLWLATGLLEANDRYQEALPIYLRLAHGTSTYADDAAFRAWVLAQRLGNDAAAAEARELVPAGSFFGLKLGKPLPLPTADTLPEVHPPVLDLAAALAQVHDLEAAIGELVFALQDAPDEATTVAIAAQLQSYGEFRQSQRAAQRYVSSGSRELRTWQLAYPQAYPEVVTQEARAIGIEPELAWAIMRQESAFYPRAVSRSNARGLMQVIPSTWSWLAELQNEPPRDPFDPAANIRYGIYYLGWLENYFDGDMELVISSYNRGQGYIRKLFEGPVVNGDKNELYREIDALETREYLQRVAVNYRIYHELYDLPELAARPADGEP